MNNEEYIGIVKDGAFVALSPESVAGIRLRLTRAAMQASFPPEHEELDLTEYEGKAIMIRGHGGGGEWVGSTEELMWQDPSSQRPSASFSLSQSPGR